MATLPNEACEKCGRQLCDEPRDCCPCHLTEDNTGDCTIEPNGRACNHCIDVERRLHEVVGVGFSST